MGYGPVKERGKTQMGSCLEKVGSAKPKNFQERNTVRSSLKEKAGD